MFLSHRYKYYIYMYMYDRDLCCRSSYYSELLHCSLRRNTNVLRVIRYIYYIILYMLYIYIFLIVALVEGLSSTRLETRTKESSMHASM